MHFRSILIQFWYFSTIFCLSLFANEPDPRIIFEKASSCYALGDYLQSEAYFLEFVQNYPDLPKSEEALYFACKASAQYETDVGRRLHLSKLFLEKHPNSPFAPEAYLLGLNVNDYLYGPDTTLLYLKKIHSLFPLTPFRTLAYYLEGLRDEAIAPSSARESFEQAAKIYQKLMSDPAFKDQDQESFYTFALLSILQKAHLEEKIAQNSRGAKKTIYYEYALQSVKDGLALKGPAQKSEENLRLQSDLIVFYSQTLIEMQRFQEAKEWLNTTMDSNLVASLTGIANFKLLKQSGEIALKEERLSDAFDFLEKAEEASSLISLPQEEQLQLWMDQAHVQRRLGNWDESMRLFSRVVNASVVSILRLEAMYERAELYLENGKKAHAIKQLESLAKQPNSWGDKAKEKLSTIYRIHI